MVLFVETAAGSEVKKRYFAELDGDKQAANEVLQYMENGEATLRHAARVLEYNHAVALLG